MFKLKTKHFINLSLDPDDITHPNQCGKLEHLDYKCSVKVYARETLNARGFVIDHSTIREVVRETFSGQISSCEEMAQKVGLAVKDKLVSEDVGFYRVHVKIKPVSDSPYEFGSVTYIHTYQQL